jgi:hypothetical protein
MGLAEQATPISATQISPPMLIRLSMAAYSTIRPIDRSKHKPNMAQQLRADELSEGASFPAAPGGVEKLAAPRNSP